MKKKIKKQDAGVRLDVFLASLLEETRSQLQKAVTSGLVTVNSKIAKSNYRLKEADVLEYRNDKLTVVAKEKKKTKAVKSSKHKFKIVFECEDYLVINKPAGLTVHRAEHFDDDEVCLSDLLVAKYPEIAEVGEDKLRPGIVHRLDKDVSGLMVVARNNDFFRNLKKQFQSRTIDKEYTALVYGKIEKNSDRIDFPIKRSSQGHKMAAVPSSYLDTDNVLRDAITDIEMTKRYENFSLLSARILTGRTHQIRVHLFAYGHPVVGDDLYSTKRSKEQNAKLALGRVFLVSRFLGFYDSIGNYQEYSIKLPTELAKFLTEKVR